MHWRGGAREVVYLVYLQEQRLADVVPQQLEAGVVQQVPDIIAPASKEVVEADYFVTLEDQPLTQVRPNETRTARHQHLHCFHHSARIAPADLHRIAAAGKYHAEDVRQRTYLSVIFLTPFEIERQN
jgi:hypothetical protein